MIQLDDLARRLVSDQVKCLVDQLLFMLIVHDQINAQVVFNRIGVQARMTSGYHQAGIRVTALQTPDLLPRFPIRLGGHRTGVENHKVGLLSIGRDLMPKLHELIGPGLEFGFIEPASKRLEINIHLSITPKKVRGFYQENLCQK